METLNLASSFPIPQAPAPSWPDDGRHGVLNVHKPCGWTSHDVVKHLRGVLGSQKIGHAGTLDPAATGVLPILIGKGTKIAEYLLGWDKEYVAVMRLGQRTDTQDATGNILEEVSVGKLSEMQIRSAIARFQGTIQQVPPMFSAVKVKGLPLYKLAHKGKTVEREARSVHVERLEVLSIRGAEIDLRVVCSKGTYIRTLCADIGEQLQVGGHLQRLERRRVGVLHIDQALELKDISEVTLSSGGGQAWKSLDEMLQGFRAVRVSPADVTKVIHGNAIPWSALSLSAKSNESDVPLNEILRVKDEWGRLLALGQLRLLDEGAPAIGRSVSMIKVLVDTI